MVGIFRGTVQKLPGTISGTRGVLLRLEENLSGALRGVAHRFKISIVPPSTAPTVFFFQNDNNAYPADLYGTARLANFNLIT